MHYIFVFLQLIVLFKPLLYCWLRVRVQNCFFLRSLKVNQTNGAFRCFMTFVLLLEAVYRLALLFFFMVGFLEKVSFFFSFIQGCLPFLVSLIFDIVNNFFKIVCFLPFLFLCLCSDQFMTILSLKNYFTVPLERLEECHSVL